MSLLRAAILFSLGFASFWYWNRLRDPAHELRTRLEAVDVAGDQGSGVEIRNAALSLQERIKAKGVDCAIEISESVSGDPAAAYNQPPGSAYSALNALAGAFHCTPVLVDENTVLLIPSDEAPARQP